MILPSRARLFDDFSVIAEWVPVLAGYKDYINGWGHALRFGQSYPAGQSTIKPILVAGQGRLFMGKSYFQAKLMTWYESCIKYPRREKIGLFKEARNMKRRDFLKSSAIAGGSFGLALLLQSACSSNNSSPSGPTDTTNQTFTSSSDSGHTHTVSVAKTEVETPPSGGVSRQTSSNSGHTHTFTISQAQLTTVKGGGTVSTTTSNDAGHTHTFSISKWY